MKMNRVIDVRSVVHSILGVLGKSGGRASVIMALELTEGFKLDISQCGAQNFSYSVFDFDLHVFVCCQ
jgi:hypothetical protein